jgi:CRISPR-associated exonuclease Cas4
MMDPQPIVSISAIEHYEYCARQCALIHVDGVWVESEHTERGHRGHRRVDSGAHRTERGRLVLRGIALWSETLGLVGRADAVEVDQHGAMAPVEYKAGRRHGRTADLQVCAQALCLEEMAGRPVPVGHVWYGGTRRRVTVELDHDLRTRTVCTIEAIRSDMRAGRLPPAVDDERCSQCQLIGHCLPEVSAHADLVSEYLDREVFRCES